MLDPNLFTTALWVTGLCAGIAVLMAVALIAIGAVTERRTRQHHEPLGPSNTDVSTTKELAGTAR